MREKKIERYLHEQCTQRGFLCLKFVSPTCNGVPDRIVITPRQVVFVETKGTSTPLRRLQRMVHQRMRMAGARVDVLCSRADVDAFIAQFSEENTP